MIQEYELEAYFGDFLEEYERQADEMLEEHDWDTIVQHMDDELREEVHSEIAPCDEKTFLLAYIAWHTEKYREDFRI